MSAFFAAMLMLIAPLAAQTITVVSPNGGETLAKGGSPFAIEWTARNVDQNVKIVLLQENGDRFGLIAEGLEPGGSPYRWTVGETRSGEAPAGNYKVRVVSDDGAVKDESDRVFAIAGAGGSPAPDTRGAPAPRLRILKPNGGEKLKQGELRPIAWESLDLRGPLRLALFKGRAKIGDISGDLPANRNTYDWEVGRLANGDMAPAGEDYTIAVKAAGGASDASDKPFIISDRAGGVPGSGMNVRILVQGSRFKPGDRLRFTYDCSCGFPTGADEYIDSIFLKRRGWSRNLWLGVGMVTRDATSGSKIIDLAPGLDQADDWVISIWFGDGSCSGASAPFSIRSPAGSPILDFPHVGETLYREWDFEVDWDRTLPNWDRVKIELLKGDSVVHGWVNGAMKSHWWRVGTTAVWESSRPVPEGGDYMPYADGSDFRIRLTDCDTGETVESGLFSIATPRIAILVPSGPGHFKRGQRIMVSWRGHHLPPRIEHAYILLLMCDSSGRCNRGLGNQCYPGRGGSMPAGSFPILRDATAAEGNFSWLVPAEDDGYLWPCQDCDPFQIRIQVKCLQGSHIKGETDLLTIEHD